MVDGVVGRDHATVFAERVAGVGVDVEPRVVAARDVNADPVPLLEDIRGRIERDGDRLDLVVLERSRLAVEAASVSRAQDRVAEVEVESERIVRIGRDLIDQLRGEIGVEALELIQSLTSTVPVTSRLASRGGVRKTSTSRRSESGSRLPAAWVSSRGRWS